MVREGEDKPLIDALSEDSATVKVTLDWVPHDNPELAAMNCLDQIMCQFSDFDPVDVSSNARIASWFYAKYGGG